MPTQPTGTESQRKIMVAFGVCLLSFAGLGIGNGSLSLYTVPMTEALGIPRATFTAYDTFAKVVGCLLSLCFPLLYRHIGARGVALIGGLGYALQYLCMAFATNVWLVWLGGVFGGIGFTFAGTLAIFAILTPWFPKNIGTLSALAAAMSGISACVFIQLVVRWIGAFGYHQALIIEAALIGGMCLIAMFLIKTNAYDEIAGEKREDETKKDRIGGIEYYKKMFATSSMLLSLLIFFLAGGLGNSFSQSIVPIAEARGFTIGATVLSIVYFVLVPAKIATGYIRDKFGLHVVTPVLFTLVIISTLLVGFGNERMLYGVGLTFGIGTVVAQIWPMYFLMAAFGKYYDAGMVGAGMAMWQIGNAIGVPAIHIPYDLTGSYDISMIVWTVLWIFLWGLSYYTLHSAKKYQLRRDAEIATDEQTP